MRISRTLPVVLAVVIVAAAVTIAVQLRKHAPPEAARLLPGADAFFFLDLSWARKANSGKELPAVSHDPEYQRFIGETGFEFERDLDEAAFAVHYAANGPGGPKGAPQPEPRFSEVFIGKFDGGKLTAYLKKHARSVENYQSIDIYSIPIEDRTLRVAILGVDAVAASNLDDPVEIHAMVERSRRLASPFGGPALLRRYYKRVQLSSPVWLIAHVDPSSRQFGGAMNFLSHPADLVISASFNPLRLALHPGAVHVRAEIQTAGDDDARTLADKVGGFLSLTHAAENSAGATDADADIKAMFESMKVKQDGDRAVLTAAVPLGLLHRALAGSADATGPGAPAKSAAPPP